VGSTAAHSTSAGIHSCRLEEAGTPLAPEVRPSASAWSSTVGSGRPDDGPAALAGTLIPPVHMLSSARLGRLHAARRLLRNRSGCSAPRLRGRGDARARGVSSERHATVLSRQLDHAREMSLRAGPGCDLPAKRNCTGRAACQELAEAGAILQHELALVGGSAREPTEARARPSLASIDLPWQPRAAFL